MNSMNIMRYDDEQHSMCKREPNALDDLHTALVQRHELMNHVGGGHGEG